ncbi:MAG: hypothetical protein NW223_01765 [Hyphomicrobiaceae bacterium]|nr:hypothetical protein [Hyphomicrobiaceae bacterium]
MERSPSPPQSAEDLVEALVRQEAAVVDEVRAMLAVHRERRVELRRELHALFGQFGRFPRSDNVLHLRLVHGGASSDRDPSA